MNSRKLPPDKVIGMYQELRLSMDKAEVLLWKILRHPTATDEQLAEAVRSFRASQAGFVAIRDSLRSIFPQPVGRGLEKQFPWNRRD